MSLFNGKCSHTRQSKGRMQAEGQGCTEQEGYVGKEMKGGRNEKYISK